MEIGRASYTNHLGECFVFGDATGAHLTTDTDVFSYERDYDANAGGYATTVPASREITLAAAFDGTVPRSRGRLFEVIDADADAGRPGTLRLGEWEMQGVFVASELDPFYLGDGTGIRRLTFLTRQGLWRRHVVKVFDPTDTRAAIINESHRPSPVTLEVFGPADTVNVGIGGLTYEVAASVPDGGRLVVDGLSKTAVVVSAGGTETNVLDKRVGTQVRGSGSYLFEPIPSGYSEVTWHPKNDLRVTVHEQRLEVGLG